MSAALVTACRKNLLRVVGKSEVMSKKKRSFTNRLYEQAGHSKTDQLPAADGLDNFDPIAFL